MQILLCSETASKKAKQNNTRDVLVQDMVVLFLTTLNSWNNPYILSHLGFFFAQPC